MLNKDSYKKNHNKNIVIIKKIKNIYNLISKTSKIKFREFINKFMIKKWNFVVLQMFHSLYRVTYMYGKYRFNIIKILIRNN